MRHWSVKLARLLILGPMMNVAVAWACTLSSTTHSIRDFGEFNVRVNDHSRSWRSTRIESGIGYAEVGSTYHTRSTRGYIKALFENQPAEVVERERFRWSETSVSPFLDEVRAGWPAYSLKRLPSDFAQFSRNRIKVG